MKGKSWSKPPEFMKYNPSVILLFSPLYFHAGQVIQAWELGVQTMKKGEICILTCKSDYAYGRQGRPPTIPENATLVFEVELLYWSDEKVTFDELVSKRILKRGSGTENVGDGGTVDGKHLFYIFILSYLYMYTVIKTLFTL